METLWNEIVCLGVRRRQARPAEGMKSALVVTSRDAGTGWGLSVTVVQPPRCGPYRTARAVGNQLAARVLALPM